jgi:hypothetical protein
LEYKDLVEKNRAALDTMARGSALPNCDWGIDYELGPNAPVDYVRKALELGRLNVLNAFHLSITRNTEGAVRAVATGLRFSHDVANGGTVFAAVVAKNLLVEHLRAMVFLLHVAGLSAQQRQSLRKAVAELGPEGLDWRSAVQRELAVLSVPTPRPEGVGKLDAEASAALDRISSEYVEALNNPSRLPHLKELIASAPKPLADVIPNPTRVVQEKQDLARQIKQVGSLLK